MVDIAHVKRRIANGLQDMFINMLRYPQVFSLINTRYQNVDDKSQNEIMELATRPMEEKDATRIMELLL